MKRWEIVWDIISKTRSSFPSHLSKVLVNGINKLFSEKSLMKPFYMNNILKNIIVYNFIKKI